MQLMCGTQCHADTSTPHPVHPAGTPTRKGVVARRAVRWVTLGGALEELGRAAFVPSPRKQCHTQPLHLTLLQCAPMLPAPDRLRIDCALRSCCTSTLPAQR